MKIPFLFFLYTAVAFSSIAQRISISSPMHNAKWPFGNLYQIQVKDIPCSKIVVKVNQGEISQFGCKFTYQPDSLGYAVFRVYRRSGRRLHLIDTVQFGVGLNERVYVMLGIHSGGFVSKSEALADGGILVKEFVNDGHAEGIHLISFRIIAIRQDSAWSIQNVGREFSAQAISLLQGMQPNDRLIIADIVASDWKRSSVSVRPAEFTIR